MVFNLLLGVQSFSYFSYWRAMSVLLFGSFLIQHLVVCLIEAREEGPTSHVARVTGAVVQQVTAEKYGVTCKYKRKTPYTCIQDMASVTQKETFGHYT